MNQANNANDPIILLRQCREETYQVLRECQQEMERIRPLDDSVPPPEVHREHSPHKVTILWGSSEQTVENFWQEHRRMWITRLARAAQTAYQEIEQASGERERERRAFYKTLKQLLDWIKRAR
jgi:hypothetical protein